MVAEKVQNPRNERNISLYPLTPEKVLQRIVGAGRLPPDEKKRPRKKKQ